MNLKIWKEGNKYYYNWKDKEENINTSPVEIDIERLSWWYNNIYSVNKQNDVIADDVHVLLKLLR